MRSTRTTAAAVAVAAAVLALVPATAAQAAPAKPVTAVTAAAPGGNAAILGIDYATWQRDVSAVIDAARPGRQQPERPRRRPH